jgi:hypothetical protein
MYLSTTADGQAAPSTAVRQEDHLEENHMGKCGAKESVWCEGKCLCCRSYVLAASDTCWKCDLIIQAEHEAIDAMLEEAGLGSDPEVASAKRLRFSLGIIKDSPTTISNASSSKTDMRQSTSQNGQEGQAAPSTAVRQEDHPWWWSKEDHLGKCGQSCLCCRSEAGADFDTCRICDLILSLD